MATKLYHSMTQHTTLYLTMLSHTTIQYHVQTFSRALVYDALCKGVCRGSTYGH